MPHSFHSLDVLDQTWHVQGARAIAPRAKKAVATNSANRQLILLVKPLSSCRDLIRSLPGPNLNLRKCWIPAFAIQNFQCDYTSPFYHLSLCELKILESRKPFIVLIYHRFVSFVHQHQVVSSSLHLDEFAFCNLGEQEIYKVIEIKEYGPLGGPPLVHHCAP